MFNIDFRSLKTKYIGKRIIHYNEIDSTQKEIWRRVEKNNIENGTLIVADVQTNGIGTHGRKWYTENSNIAFSLVLFPNCSINALDNFTIEIAEILVGIFEKLYHIKLDIKKPNDLIISGKKVGGILVETKLQGDIVKSLVIGIGINTNQEILKNEIKEIATSIKNEFSITINNYDVILEFCNRLEKYVERIN